MRNCNGWESVNLVYRFLELHDLPNIPKIDLVIYAMKHRLATVTAPFKSYLEEKLLFYLFHHPELDEFWRGALGTDTQARLQRMLPPTWLLDPQPIPPTAAVDPPLMAGKRRIRHWDDLRGLSQRERRLVLKPSGFSELPGAAAASPSGTTSTRRYGTRPSTRRWQASSRPRTSSSNSTRAAALGVSYYDVEFDAIRPMTGARAYRRTTWSWTARPGYAACWSRSCPPSNKVIHGTSESVMMPAMVSDEAEI